MTTRYAPMACLLLAVACSPAALPLPRITSVEPATALETASFTFKIHLSAVLPFEVDYLDGKATVDASARVFLNDVLLSVAAVDASNTIQTTVAAGLSPGRYALRVELADGRSATLVEALQITPSPWPTGYSVDVVADQLNGVPFVLTVRALGPSAQSYAGSLTIGSNKLVISPSQSRPFVAGVLTEQLTVTGVGSGVQVVVTDPRGLVARSNPFTVQ